MLLAQEAEDGAALGQLLAVHLEHGHLLVEEFWGGRLRMVIW
jgi:hypothetical protein